jgi:hypothetical protein
MPNSLEFIALFCGAILCKLHLNNETNIKDKLVRISLCLKT